MPPTPAGRSPSPHDAATTTPASPARAILSRLKSPFVTAKSRHVDEFEIRPDDPHRVYSAGESLTGNVILKVVKPLRVTHITVCLHGFVQVYKSANNPGDSYRAYTGTSTPGKTMRTGYFGNGFASLFQDEEPLCGEGRLGEGTYQFGFELIFPKMKLPSSIDFERGTISYMITCTLTKPTTIAPTTIIDHKIKFGEDVNIAALPQPKPRVITLEPIKRPRRAKHAAAKHRSVTATDGEQRNTASTTGSEGSAAQRSSAAAYSQADADSVMSPSEASLDSCVSSCDPESARSSVAPSALSNGGSKGPSSEAAGPARRAIIATVELSQAGFLRGDTVQLRINIQHTKVVRSLHGIIVTFYRQARVDMHPQLPVIGKDGKQEKTEDYYPRSMTGLGGLSLSAAGSTHVFRKDMSQSFAPLIVNPDTMVADGKAAVRVPEEAFPTISSVPGAMISFKYYVEVILDLQGKLTGLDRLFPSSGTQFGPGAGTNNMMGGGGVLGGGAGAGGGNPMMSAWGGHLIDTQDIRREKSIVSCLFEIVIGTRDSERIPGRRAAAQQQQQQQIVVQPADQGGAVQQQPHASTNGGGDSGTDPTAVPDGDPEPYAWDGYDYGYENGGDGSYDQSYGYDSGYGYGYSNGYHYPSIDQSVAAGAPPSHPHHHPAPVPLPDLEEEAQLPEKERMRRAEARLLPSQPPDAEDEAEASNAGASAPRDVGPSAPALDMLELHAAGSGPSPATAEPWGSSSTSRARVEDDAHGNEDPSGAAPAYPGPAEPASASSSRMPAPTDDKHELHRRRLEMERSAPEEEDEPLPAGEQEQQGTAMSRPPESTGVDGAPAPNGVVVPAPSRPPEAGGDEGASASAPPASEVRRQRQELEHHDDGDDHDLAGGAFAQLPRYER